MKLIAFLLFVAAAAAQHQIHITWVEEPSTTLTFCWRADAAPELQYRAVGAKAWSTAKGALNGVQREVTLRGLKPATRYEYRVGAGRGVWSDPRTVRTAPRGPAGFDVAFVADTGMIGRADGLTTGTRQVIDEVAKLDPLLVLWGGDGAYYNTDKRWGSLENTIDAWFEQMKPVAVKAPMMPTFGNHEVFLGENYDAWAARFPVPEGHDGRRNYSFDVGNAHFVSILAAHSSAGELPAATLDWIERDIAAARRRGQTWIVPFLHVAPFSDGSNHPSNMNLRRQLGPLFERAGVHIALTSHDQSYERTYPLRGIPDAIAATSQSKECYTVRDGVSWVKVSPGGKMSNINGRFAQWKTNPAPSWTAFRDNTMHHYARLRVSPTVLHVEVFGVHGDGHPPMAQDSFRYTTRACQ